MMCSYQFLMKTDSQTENKESSFSAEAGTMNVCPVSKSTMKNNTDGRVEIKQSFISPAGVWRDLFLRESMTQHAV